MKEEAKKDEDNAILRTYPTVNNPHIFATAVPASPSTSHLPDRCFIIVRELEAPFPKLHPSQEPFDSILAGLLVEFVVRGSRLAQLEYRSSLGTHFW